jgi:hypothetical protein
MSASSNLVVVGVVGLALGFGGGYLVGDKTPQTTTQTTGIRDGEGGVTPCQAAGSIPDGQWSKVPCGASQACAILDQIQSLAAADVAAGRIGPGLLAQLNDLLLKCATNTNPATLGGAEHCQKLTAAKQAAMQHNWPQCIEHMQHGH